MNTKISVLLNFITLIVLGYVIPLVVQDLKKCPENHNLVKMQKTTATTIRIDDKIILQPEKMSEVQIVCILPINIKMVTNIFLFSSSSFIKTLMDFCSYNKKFVGKSLRYIWATGAYAPSYHQHEIIKFDFQTRKSLIWKAGLNQHVRK